MYNAETASSGIPPRLAWVKELCVILVHVTDGKRITCEHCSGMACQFIINIALLSKQSLVYL